MYDASLLLLYLAFYSLLGWVAEVLFVFATTRHLQNRGFLTGPFVPIYGFGALALIYLVSPYVTNPFLVFLASVFVSSVLEYATHLALDKIFHVKLWDYTGKRLNLHGRICLENSLLFGMLGLFLLYVIHPFATLLVGRLPETAVIAIAGILFGVLLVDAANSIRSLAKVRPILDEMHGTLAQAHEEIEHRADDLHARTVRRLSKAFPRAKSVKAAK